MSHKHTLEDCKIHWENYGLEMIDDVYINANTPLKTRCPTCGYEWGMRYNDVQRYGCPMCYRKKTSERKKKERVTESYNFGVLYPEIASEWDYELNKGLNPKDFTPFSSERVYWRCENDHSWDAPISSRTAYKTKCEYCSGRKATPENNFAILFPDLMKEWDWENNSKNPYNLVTNSDYNASWICSKCGRNFKCRLPDRAKGVGCRKCGYKRVVETKRKNNELADHNLLIDRPDIAAEWDFKTNELKPENYKCGSSDKVYWICPNCTRSYLCSIAKRTSRGDGCSYCGNVYKGELKIRQWLENNKIEYIPQYKIDDCRDKYPLPFDFGIMYNGVLVLSEYQGQGHYKPTKFKGMRIEKAEESFAITKFHDQVKRDYCIENNIKLIEIPYWEFNNIESILTKELNIQN